MARASRFDRGALACICSPEMRPRVATLALSLLAGCRGSYEPPASILTLVPAAMRVSGPTRATDDHTLCLAAGGGAEATVYVYEAPVMIVASASTPTPEAMPSFVVRLGSRMVATNTVQTVLAEAFVCRAAADPGEQVLRVMVPDSSPGRLCLHQVSVTQP